MNWPLFIIGSSVIVAGLNIKFHRDGWWFQPCNPLTLTPVEEFWRIRRRDSACRDREMADTSMSHEACAESLDSGCLTMLDRVIFAHLHRLGASG